MSVFRLAVMALGLSACGAGGGGSCVVESSTGNEGWETCCTSEKGKEIEP